MTLLTAVLVSIFDREPAMPKKRRFRTEKWQWKSKVSPQAW